MTGGRVVLRYFPVLGRAQALRHALADAGIAFEDVRVPPAEWAHVRQDPAFAGRYRALPTLSWGDATVSETLPIAFFLARHLGEYARLSDEAIAAREAACSSSYIDVILRLADVIYADLLYPGADPGRSFAAIASRIVQKLELLDAQMPHGAWIGGDTPAVADFFVIEAFESTRYFLGPARDARLRERLPRLGRLADALRERPRLFAAMKSRPARFTARPDEDRVIEALRAVDLGSAGL
jgi:glutathione S-transferase